METKKTTQRTPEEKEQLKEAKEIIESLDITEEEKGIIYGAYKVCVEVGGELLKAFLNSLKWLLAKQEAKR